MSRRQGKLGAKIPNIVSFSGRTCTLFLFDVPLKKKNLSAIDVYYWFQSFVNIFSHIFLNDYKLLFKPPYKFRFPGKLAPGISQY